MHVRNLRFCLGVEGKVKPKMGKFLGFHDWFLVLTLCLGVIFNFMVFQFKRYNVAAWIAIGWLILMIVEFKLLELEEEMWKQRVFS
jgi:cytochrome c biogenesis protein CcdA